MEMDKLNLEINANLEISYGANMDELAYNLQKFTDKYLYIDDSMTIKFVDNIIDLPYENCKLIVNKKYGFLLYEESTDRVIQVFDKYLSMYLTGEIDFSENKISEDENSENSENISSDFSDSSENILGNSSEELRCNSKKFANIITDLFIPSHISNFRIYLREIDDNDYITSVNLNKKLIEKIEKDNEIDLEKTFNLSFTTFLNNQGYNNVKVNFEFYEDIFAEIVVFSNKKIEENIIKQIEENAVLHINKNDILFFIYRENTDCNSISDDENFEEEKLNFEENTKIAEENLNFEESVYSREVPLLRLPSDLYNLVLQKTHSAPFSNDIISFYYKNSEFVLKNEGMGFYSLFDKDLLFYLSHLHPDFYPNAYEYSDLPLAQFYY